MYRPLAPCPACQRHIVATETRCPFCQHALAAPLAGRPEPTRRLSRAAVFTFAASITAAGCSSTVSNSDASPGTDAPGDVTAATDQGSPVDRPATDTGPADTGPRDVGFPDTGAVDVGFPDIGNVVPPYGLPPPVDAGGPDDDGGVMDLYGAPPDAR